MQVDHTSFQNDHGYRTRVDAHDQIIAGMVRKTCRMSQNMITPFVIIVVSLSNSSQTDDDGWKDFHLSADRFIRDMPVDVQHLRFPLQKIDNFRQPKILVGWIELFKNITDEIKVFQSIDC